MPSGTELLTVIPRITSLLIGPFSSGKTRNAITFPKCYVVTCDPAGIDIVHEAENIELAKNVIWYETLRNASESDLKLLFKENATSSERQSIYGCLAHAKEMASKGEIETFVFDGFTYFVDMRWQYVCEYEEARSSASGNLDTQAMYRNLGLYMQRFVASDLLTLSTRSGLNLIVTCHLKRESREVIEGSEKTKSRAKKLVGESDIAPMLEGGFRNKIEGLFGAHIYLDNKLQSDGKIKYVAYCEKSIGFGTVVLAGNNYGLPPQLDVTNKSFYDVVMSNINGAKSPKT